MTDNKDQMDTGIDTKVWLACAVTTEYPGVRSVRKFFCILKHIAITIALWWVISVCGLVALRKFMAGTPCKSKAKLNGKTVLITGANTGIGKETARDLAKRGARVLLACRDQRKAESAAEEIRQSTGNPNVVTYKLDLASLTSVRQCASDVIKKEPRLDVLINNAGVMWTPRWKTEDGFDMQFGTNHLGHFLLTNLLLDLLKKSAPSRIVNVSSLGHTHVSTLDFDDLNCEKSYSPIIAYSKSKLANILFTRELSKRLKNSNVTANSLHPGAVATELIRYAESDTFNVVLRWILKLLYHLVKHIVKTSVEGAQTSIHCAVAEELEGVTGKYFSECAVTKESRAARDDAAAAKLWTISEEMVGITNLKSKPT